MRALSFVDVLIDILNERRAFERRCRRPTVTVMSCSAFSSSCRLPSPLGSLDGTFFFMV